MPSWIVRAFFGDDRPVAHLVASDAHDRVRRPPGVADGLAALRRAAPDLAGLEALLTVDAPAAVLAGAAPPQARPLRAA
jgi:hypothetical protein